MGVSKMTRRIWRQIRDAANSDPDLYSPATSPDRAQSFAYAAAGCVYMLRHQKNTRIMSAATLAVFALAAWLRIDTDQWAILVLAVGGVWVAEFINAAIEAAVNLAVNDFHPMAKAAKDVAAAAVLMAALVAFAIGILVLGPPLLLRLQFGAVAA
jgi:diacylglycerol kinase